MQNNLAELTNQVSNLSNNERLKLAHILLSIDDKCKNNSELGELWEKEISQRVKSVENGTAIGIDFQDAIQAIRTKLTK